MKESIIIILLTSTICCNGQAIGEVKAEIHRQGLPCPHIVLAQARLETGNFKSKVCRTKRNLFGIRKGGKYKSYRRWQDSVADYKRLISSRYKGGDYYAFLRRIGYAEERQYISKLKRFR